MAARAVQASRTAASVPRGTTIQPCRHPSSSMLAPPPSHYAKRSHSQSKSPSRRPPPPPAAATPPEVDDLSPQAAAPPQRRSTTAVSTSTSELLHHGTLEQLDAMDRALHAHVSVPGLPLRLGINTVLLGRVPYAGLAAYTAGTVVHTGFGHWCGCAHY